MKKLLTTLAVALLWAPAAALAAQWNVDASHSTAQFAVRHMMVSNVRGEFGKISGTVSYDPKKVESTTIDVTIDAASIDTRDAKRDEHLRSADFFDVAKYPQLTFKSKKVSKKGKALKVVGDLTIHGVTKEVTLDVPEVSGTVTDPWGNTRVGAQAFTTINRKDFGITWNKALDSGGVVVGDDVKITIEVELIQAKDEKKS